MAPPPAARTPAPIASFGSSTTSYVDPSLTNGTTYSYRISATNVFGGGVERGIGHARRSTGRARAGGTGDVEQHGQPRVDPPASDGDPPSPGTASSRGTSTGGETLLALRGPSPTTYADTTAVNGTTYFYQVAAVTAIAETKSNERSATPTGPPTAPTNLTVGVAGSSATLTWSPPANNGGAAVDGYQVLRSTASGAEVGAAQPARRYRADLHRQHGHDRHRLLLRGQGTHEPRIRHSSSEVSAVIVASPIAVVVRGGDGVYANRLRTAQRSRGFPAVPGDRARAANPATVFDGTTHRRVRPRHRRARCGPRPPVTALTWSPWTSLARHSCVRIPSPHDGAGVVKVFVVGGDSALYVVSTSNGVFTPGAFVRLGGYVTGLPAVAYDGGGYQVVVRGADMALDPVGSRPGGRRVRFTARGGYLDRTRPGRGDGSIGPHLRPQAVTSSLYTASAERRRLRLHRFRGPRRTLLLDASAASKEPNGVAAPARQRQSALRPRSR